MGRPLQGPEAVKEQDIEGDEDDEAESRGQRSESGHRCSRKSVPTQPHLEGAPQSPPFSEDKANLERVRTRSSSKVKGSNPGPSDTPALNCHSRPPCRESWGLR